MTVPAATSAAFAIDASRFATPAALWKAASGMFEKLKIICTARSEAVSGFTDGTGSTDFSSQIVSLDKLHSDLTTCELVHLEQVLQTVESAGKVHFPDRYSPAGQVLHSEQVVFDVEVQSAVL